MRLFETLEEAISEIQRDVYKGSPTMSTRVQQRVDVELKGREVLGYSYAIEELGFPSSPQELVTLGARYLPFWKKHGDMIESWLSLELHRRQRPAEALGVRATENYHPALISTIEGNHPSYTYPERLLGMKDAVIGALSTDVDSRRAFWPIFRETDAYRASAATRVPCSLGYQFLIRNTPKGERLIIYYLSRSVDFDTFWLSDIWLAYALQEHLAHFLDTTPGQVFHTIVSFHSFAVEGTEVY